MILMSMITTKSFAYDIKVDNADGVTIYYNWINHKTELAVTHKGNSFGGYTNSYSGNVIIPESVQYNGHEYHVTSIGDNAFMSCRNLTSVTIPNCVISIGTWAFKDCGILTSISIPSNVTSIGSAAFSGTGWYNNQNDGPLYLDNWLLGYKGNMTTGTLSIRVKTKGIADNAFYGRSDLTSISSYNYVKIIGNSAFENCTGLTSISINSVTNIGNSAFNGCSNLSTATIGNNVKSIGTYAFNNCSSLTSINIPNSVTSIGNGAFTGTGWYNSQKNGLIYLDNWLLGYKTNTGGSMLEGDLSIKEGTKGIADYALYLCYLLTSVTIPNSVTSIGEYAFYLCFGLSSITIPNSVTKIGNFAFHHCGLTSIEVEAGNTIYDSRDNCNAIIETETNKLIFGCQNSTIPNSITSIGDFAFSECSLASITIPNSVTNIGERVFQGCQNLTDIVVESGNSIYDSRDNCNAIIETQTNTLIFGCKNTSIPNSITSIGEYAFESHNLPSITIPNSVTTIGEYAFYRCGLTSITIPNSVTSIGDYAFMQCYNLATITIPNSVTRIGNYVFWDSSLTSVIIPNSVTRIGRAAFRNCNILTSITIPSSVTRIDDEAFSGCVNLNSVTSLNTTPPSIYSSTFNPNRSLAPACLFKIKVLCCPPKSKKSLPLIHGSHKT